MILELSGLVLALGVVALSVVVRRGFNATHRGLTSWSEGLLLLVSTVSQLASRESSGTSPELLERLESVERRTEAALGDLNVQLRRLGQRRRQLLETETGEELPDQEQLELANQLSAARPSAPSQENGRPRLARRR